MENVIIDFFNTKLDKKERQQLDVTGFFVQETGFIYLIVSVMLIIFWIPGDLLLLCLITQSPVIISNIVFCIAFVYVGWYTWQYARFSVLFHFERGIISGGKVYSSQKQVVNDIIKLSDPLRILIENNMPSTYSIILKIKSLKQKLWIVYLFLWFGIVIVGIEEKDLLRETFKMFGVYVLMIISIISIAYIAHYYSIYYRFGKLGEKIQKLTPEIESESNLIQSGFEKDMNFAVLHSGFEKLSSTFSKIVSLVLKLERVEAQANKGNLFDSEKYINSLRSDIVTPLSSLQQFLENQKVELLKSQKELSGVGAGGSESTGNIELQSKRSESLIAELDTNIGALIEMIGKMG